MIERTKVDTEAPERELEARYAFVTVAELAERWRISEDTVRAILFDRLPYVSVGRGSKRIHRRYDRRVVEEFERRGRGK